jgi:carboxyl-terminal processing protease
MAWPAKMLTALALLSALCGALYAATPGDEKPLRAAETFAMVWEKLRFSHADDGSDAPDWIALEQAHRAPIESARDLATLRLEIQRLLSAIGVSHLSLIPAEAVPAPSASNVVEAAQNAAGPNAAPDSGYDTDPAHHRDARDTESSATAPLDGGSVLGLRAAVVDGGLYAVAVEPGSAAAEAGIRPGWQLLAIDDWTPTSALNRFAAMAAGPQRRRGETRFEFSVNEPLQSLKAGERVRLRMRDPAGASRTFTLAARAKSGRRIRLMPGMPETILRYRAERLALPGGDCALRVEFDLWAQPAFEQLAATLREHPECQRLVLDLRGNPGGQLWSMIAIGGLLHERTTDLGTIKNPQSTQKLVVLPRRVADDGSKIQRLRGPVAILVDRGSASCSEIFASGMQANGRARIFGETSAGMALPAVTARLPSGDWLYFPTGDMKDPKGRRVEGLGVVPDVSIETTVASLRVGGDPAFEAALAWVGNASAEIDPNAR